MAIRREQNTVELFTFPSRYLSAIGLAPVFSLGWSLPPAWGCNPKQPDSTSANPHPAAPGFLASHPLRHTVPSRLRARTVEQWTGTVLLSRPQFATTTTQSLTLTRNSSFKIDNCNHLSPARQRLTRLPKPLNKGHARSLCQCSTRAAQNI